MARLLARALPPRFLRHLLPHLLLACAALALAGAAAAGEIKPWKGASPALELPDLDGHLHTLAEFKGKVVVINFWATWCEPCRAEMPSMQKMADKYGADQLVVLGVNYQEGAPRIRRFLEGNPVHFTILMDRDGAVAKKWTSRIFPTSIIVGPDGRARQLVIGETDWDAAAMDALIAKLLPRQK